MDIVTCGMNEPLQGFALEAEITCGESRLNEGVTQNYTITIVYEEESTDGGTTNQRAIFRYDPESDYVDQRSGVITKIYYFEMT